MSFFVTSLLLRISWRVFRGFSIYRAKHTVFLLAISIILSSRCATCGSSPIDVQPRFRMKNTASSCFGQSITQSRSLKKSQSFGRQDSENDLRLAKLQAWSNFNPEQNCTCNCSSTSLANEISTLAIKLTFSHRLLSCGEAMCKRSALGLCITEY